MSGLDGYFPQGEPVRRTTNGWPNLRGSGKVVTQADATEQRTVPNATTGAVSETVTAVAPAGGTGAQAGCWDTAGHRDTSILAINETRALAQELSTQMTAMTADVLALKKAITQIVDALQQAGIAS